MTRDPLDAYRLTGEVITGDHQRTAAVIARELAISVDGRTISGTEFESMSDEALARAGAEVSSRSVRPRESAE